MSRTHFGLAACIATLACAQEPTPAPQEPKFEAALRAWIDSDHSDRELMDGASAALLDAGPPGLRALARELAATKPEDRHRRIAVESLLSSTVLASVQRAQDSGMRFAGQHDDLRLLQPYSGRFLIGLVLDPPGWFPSDRRAALLPALRDLFAEPPDEDTLDRLMVIAKNEDFEIDALREALAVALAQWGRPELVRKRIDELVELSGPRRTVDELYFVRALAKYHYEMRAYPAAATWWARYVEGKAAIEDHVSAIDEYDIACCNALADRSDEALSAIERCAALVAADKVDSSAAITASMFDTDPDLRSIRATERFAAARKLAFPKKKKTGSGR